MLMSCGGGSRSSVRIALPLPPKLDLSDYDYVYFPGFIAETQNEGFDPDLEALNFFKREFQRREVMSIIPVDAVDLSEKDARSFFVKEQPYFKTFNFEHSENTLAVTGGITFEVLDRSGFRQVETTDISGRSYYRTQFVEISGFDLTMKVFVYNLQGQLLYTESLKDSIDVEGESIDERLVFYELLQRISDRVLGLFANTVVKAERSLL
jgi:hypothetical protein